MPSRGSLSAASDSSSDRVAWGERSVPHRPLDPSPDLERITRLSLRLQTEPARICLLRPSRSPGLGVELPEGMAFTGSPGRVLPVLGGGATAVDKAPGAHASSPS